MVLTRRYLLNLCNRPKYLAIAIASNVILCGLAFALIEGTGPITGMWWAIVTASTTGYGDFSPKSTAGRGIATWLMTSMWALSLVAGAQLTARLVANPDCFTDEEQRHIQSELAGLREDVKVLMEK